MLLQPFFRVKLEKIHTSLSHDKKASDSEVNSSENFDGIPFDQFYSVSASQVSTILHSLNPTTCKLDPLPTTILKKCSSGLISAVTTIINSSLQSSEVSNELKKAILTPLLKRQNLDVNDFGNYRPVSHLSFLSKILEKVVAAQLTEHLFNNNLLDKFQSAYSPGFSTETALIKIF